MFTPADSDLKNQTTGKKTLLRWDEELQRWRRSRSLASSNDWNWLEPHITSEALTRPRMVQTKEHNYRKSMVQPMHVHTRAKRRVAMQPRFKKTHTHTHGLESSTGICPKSEIIAAERMKQCKLIKDKKCLLLNRLKGNLIVLLCLRDSSGPWENTAALLTECYTAVHSKTSQSQRHRHWLHIQ